jgi:DNA-binding PadR family transcriptional regulator
MSPRRASPIALEYILLDLVDQKPRHGYEIFKELEKLEGIGLIWHLKQSQLYALLEKLENQGLLAGRILPGENRPDRKELRLTEPGKQQLEEWADIPVDSPRDMRQMFLAKLNHLNWLHSARRIWSLVDKQKSTCLRWETDLLAQMEKIPAGSDFTCAVLDYRLRQVQACRDWLDQLPEVLGNNSGDIWDS